MPQLTLRGPITFGGSINIYSLGPVPVLPSSADAQTPLATRTRINQIITRTPGAFKNFYIAVPETEYAGTFPLDPIEGYTVEDQTQNLQKGFGSAWRRAHRTVVPPRAAKYLVPRVRVKDVPPSTNAYIDSVQAEIPRFGTASPSAYDNARGLNILVRPTRLNYAHNPSFEVSDNLWSAEAVNGTDTVAGSRVNAASRSGDWSYEVSAAGPATVTHTVDSLVPGETYVGSVYVSTNGGEYERLAKTFKAELSEVTVSWLLPELSTYPATYHVDDCLVEQSDGRLEDYFDGSFGDDYLWEGDATPGESRSYYYESRTARHYIIRRTLEENVPVGVFVNLVEYAKPPSPPPRPYGSGAYGSGPYGV